MEVIVVVLIIHSFICFLSAPGYSHSPRLMPSQGTETCLILEGDVTVTPDDGREAVTVGAGDLCVFPDGMKCTWDVRAAIQKHYKFE